MSTLDNLRAWRQGASPQHIEDGTDWYPLARRIARDMNAQYGCGVDTAAGVIAALSPRCYWQANLDGADKILRAISRGEDPPTALPGVYGRNLEKAVAIARHGDGFPRCNGRRPKRRGNGETDCQPTRDNCAAAEHLHGPKVSEFAETIAGNPDGRVMDVWATRAADVAPSEVLTLAADDPRRAGVPTGRIPQLQAAYAAVAAEFNEPASVTQAIVWTRIRETWLRSDGRRNGAREIPF